MYSSDLQWYELLVELLHLLTLNSINSQISESKSPLNCIGN